MIRLWPHICAPGVCTAGLVSRAEAGRQKIKYSQQKSRGNGIYAKEKEKHKTEKKRDDEKDIDVWDRLPRMDSPSPPPHCLLLAWLPVWWQVKSRRPCVERLYAGQSYGEGAPSESWRKEMSRGLGESTSSGPRHWDWTANGPALTSRTPVIPDTGHSLNSRELQWGSTAFHEAQCRVYSLRLTNDTSSETLFKLFMCS